MHIMAFGRDLSGRLLFPATSEQAFGASLSAGLERNAKSLRQLAAATSGGVTFRGEVGRRVVDAGDPRQAGWTFLVSTADPARESIIAALTPLAEHRGMSDPSRPLLFGCESEDDWAEWLQDNFFARQLAGERVPQYVLMVGNPSQLPFKLQSLLETVASVGRIDFDEPAHIGTYAEKLVRLETKALPVVDRHVLFFAPDGGPSDPTYFSREYMVLPLIEHIRGTMGFRTTAHLGHDATKAKLVQSLLASRPALVYTASHGLGLVGQALDRQQRYNGAICCQAVGEWTSGDLFTAEDVPAEQPFLEGAVFFQFACFGYGTPGQSDYAHWLDGVPQQYAERDFIAALPKRLLAHRRGPVAYIGHLDTAFLHGFTDQNEAHIADRWHGRIQPFVASIERLLQVQPSGLAMEDMNKRFAVFNALLMGLYDRQKRGTFSWTPDSRARFIDNWIIRSDAQNYMVFGDPAARLRIPSH